MTSVADPAEACAFLQAQQQEWDKFNATVSPTDYDWYLETV